MLTKNINFECHPLPSSSGYGKQLEPRSSLTSSMRVTLRTHPPGLASMAATSGAAGSGEPDMALIGELLEEISRHPPAIAARKLLCEHYISIGWLDAAT